MTTTLVVPPNPVGAYARKRIYFIRHGETDWNREARLQGQQDIPLNDVGRKQAATVAHHLRETAGPGADTLPWIVSPMGRTMETMAIARYTIGLPKAGYSIDERLKEISFGRWEGMTWKEVKRADPPGAAARSSDKWGYIPPGGESYAMLLNRVRPVFEELPRESIVVAHGGVARVMLALLAGMNPTEATVADIWQGRLLVFENGGAFWAP